MIQFYGNAIKRDVVIELSGKVLESRGGAVVVDSLVVPNLRHRWAFNLYAKRLNLDERVKAGHYELKRGMDVVDIVRMLKLGHQTPVRVIFNNARGVGFLARRISGQIDLDSVEIAEAIVSKEFAEELGYRSEELMSIFIPNTYELWWTISPEELVRRMNVEYNRFWTDEREAARKVLGLSRVEVSTLASIVYEETAKVGEMPRVAGVYVNRLRRGMRLQADPTVKYALGDFSLQRVLNKHLKYDSPYNTYLYKGLPPGPISVPSIAALDAVLNYEKHKYIYFCARAEMDGYHNFATTYSQHLKNAKLYTDELNRREAEKRGQAQ